MGSGQHCQGFEEEKEQIRIDFSEKLTDGTQVFPLMFFTFFSVFNKSYQKLLLEKDEKPKFQELLRTLVAH